MSNSPRIGLPYLDAAQAQKHVTVNEALARLDVVSAARVESMALIAPPGSPAEVEAHLVPAGAIGAWSGMEGTVAVFLNGGWDFIAPWAGWQLWVAGESATAIYDGTGWQLASQFTSPGGALTALRNAEIDHVIAAGSTSTTSAFIPDKAIVLGVTARVTAQITGPTSWSLGVSGSPDRYGSGFGTSVDSYAHGVSGSPLAYYGGSSLLLTSAGDDFIGGTVRIVAHYFELSPPRTV